MASRDNDEERCPVCAEPIADADQAQCECCGRPFHFGFLRRFGTGDCGAVHFFCGPVYVCADCESDVPLPAMALAAGHEAI